MVAIKDMEMPSCCMNCEMQIDGLSAGYYCLITKEELNDNSTLKHRHPNCPLMEIETCKNCKWLTTDEDGNYYCIQTGCFDSLDFYCADFEKRGNENG